MVFIGVVKNSSSSTQIKVVAPGKNKKVKHSTQKQFMDYFMKSFQQLNDNVNTLLEMRSEVEKLKSTVDNLQTTVETLQFTVSTITQIITGAESPPSLNNLLQPKGLPIVKAEPEDNLFHMISPDWLDNHNGDSK